MSVPAIGALIVSAFAIVISISVIRTGRRARRYAERAAAAAKRAPHTN